MLVDKREYAQYHYLPWSLFDRHAFAGWNPSSSPFGSTFASCVVGGGGTGDAGRAALAISLARQPVTWGGWPPRRYFVGAGLSARGGVPGCDGGGSVADDRRQVSVAAGMAATGRSE